MAEFDCVGDDLALGVSIDKLEAAVGLHGWTNVEPILGTLLTERRLAGDNPNWAVRIKPMLRCDGTMRGVDGGYG